MNLSRLVPRLIRLLLLATAFTLVFVSSSTLFPFTFGRIMLLRGLIEAAFLLTMLVVICKPLLIKQMPGWGVISRGNAILFAFIFFVIWMGISSIFALNPYQAFFGTMDRGEGLWATIHFLLFIFLAVLFFEKKTWRIYFHLLVLNGLMLAWYSLGQYMGIGFTWPTLVDPSTQPGSLLGNPAYVAGAYLLLMGVLTVLWKETTNKLLKGLYGICGIIFFIGIAISGIRGAIIGLAVGLVCTAASYFFGSHTSKKLKKLAAGLVVVLVILAMLFIATRENNFWKRIPGLNRLSALRVENSSFQVRYSLLKSSWESFKQKPIVGWGPENFFMANNINLDTNASSFSSEWGDRPHNKIAEVAVTTGIIGLIVFICFWGVAIYKTKRYSPLLMGFIIAQFVHTLFLFDTTVSFLLYTALIAFVVSQDKPTHEDHSHSKSTFMIYRVIAVLCLFVISYGLYSWILIPIKQQSVFKNILLSKDTISAKNYYDEMITPYNFTQTDSRFYATTVLEDKYKNTEKAYSPLLKDMIDSLEETLQYRIQDPRIHTKLIHLYVPFVKANPKLKPIVDRHRYLSAVWAPRRQDIYFGLIIELIKYKEFDAALEMARDVVNINPDIARTHIYLAMAIAQRAQTLPSEEGTKKEALNKEADSELKKFDELAGIVRQTKQRYTVETGLTETQYHIIGTDDFTNAALLLGRLKDYQTMNSVLTAATKILTSDIKMHLFYMQSQYHLGDKEGVKATLAKIIAMRGFSTFANNADVLRVQQLVNENKWAQLEQDSWFKHAL